MTNPVKLTLLAAFAALIASPVVQADDQRYHCPIERQQACRFQRESAQVTIAVNVNGQGVGERAQNATVVEPNQRVVVANLGHPPTQTFRVNVP